jgi:hypothetical protein
MLGPTGAERSTNQTTPYPRFNSVRIASVRWPLLRAGCHPGQPRVGLRNSVRASRPWWSANRRGSAIAARRDRLLPIAAAGDRLAHHPLVVAGPFGDDHADEVRVLVLPRRMSTSRTSRTCGLVSVLSRAPFQMTAWRAFRRVPRLVAELQLASLSPGRSSRPAWSMSHTWGRPGAAALPHWLEPRWTGLAPPTS